MRDNEECAKQLANIEASHACLAKKLELMRAGKTKDQADNIIEGECAIYATIPNEQGNGQSIRDMQVNSHPPLRIRNRQPVAID